MFAFYESEYSHILMLPDLKIEAVSERDIDLLILEELTVSQEFAQFFINEVGLKNELKSWEVYHSVTESDLGESDLILLCNNSDGQRNAILIENKIDADAQPEQADRYKKRGELGRSKGDWSTFITCIIAPQKYLNSKGDADLYDFQISYEKLIDMFDCLNGIDEQRKNYRKNLLKLAIEQQRRGYAAKIDEAVTEFWQSYYNLLSDDFDILKMDAPKSKPKKAGFIHFKPDSLIGGNFKLMHKFPFGRVDLQTSWLKEDIEECKKRNVDILDKDMNIIKTGKSCSVSISVPLMDAQKSFLDQQESAHLALQSAVRLLEISKSIVEK